MKRTHNKDDIVQTGLEIIFSRGFNGTGIETILKQANVPKGSFYNFFSSKEEFGLAVIDLFLSDMTALLKPISEDLSLPPLERIRRSFELLIARFEENNCSKGCLLANLGLEMSDQCEPFRQRLEDALQRWIDSVAEMLEEARETGAVRIEVAPSVLAESMVASFEGALLRAKVKKSVEPLKNFIHLYFNVFLA
ncbi:TetR/AcrR family transcriptional regulator [Geomonas propionica]|uniref:TetR family transcriptional regulator C-terminal domain-containing protein n=1 Tax=Geomonas propionica TaxID=2798582 RepID=A0ABS0YP66_9BACT|nr:TetR/AcrR family transcriptional regulator [Geomonas propionica]MBJ6799708.1 TetR family transcriptional regulator C-terminal domain-containing protein [Geomonas propionica]